MNTNDRNQAAPAQRLLKVLRKRVRVARVRMYAQRRLARLTAN
jgi:hypothetical protein